MKTKILIPVRYVAASAANQAVINAHELTAAERRKHEPHHRLRPRITVAELVQALRDKALHKLIKRTNFEFNKQENT